MRLKLKTPAQKSRLMANLVEFVAEKIGKCVHNKR